jgi:tetratricopeptide (TPR) repeat protein
LLVLLSACAAPPVVEPGDGAPAFVRAARALADEAAARPDDAALQLRAATACGVAANVLAMRFQAANLRAADGPSLADVLDAENRLDDAQRGRVRAMAEASIGCARRAIALAPDDVTGRFALAMGLALTALTKSRTAALMEGLPGDIREAADAALALDRTYHGGAPLALKGRFLAAAPWPVADLPKADELLREAVRVGPYAMHWVFLGDLRWRQGRKDEARTAWQAAATALVHPTFHEAEAAIRDLIRFRLGS